MKVKYLENNDLAVFDGKKFRRDKKTGYYLNSTIHKRLHIYVWEYYNGPIPKGYQIHHKNHDKNQNDIENLQMVTAEEHRKIHSREISDELREWYRNNLNEKARPKANEWHGSEKGKEWHKKHYEQMKDKLHKEEFKECEYCGKKFIAKAYQSEFCSNKCKSAWRRKEGLDDVERQCIICRSTFTINKYSKVKTCCTECAIKLRKRTRYGE
jgi:hypothetical protein